MVIKETSEMYVNIPSPMYETIISAQTIKTGIGKMGMLRATAKTKVI